jgi:ferredoxin
MRHNGFQGEITVVHRVVRLGKAVPWRGTLETVNGRRPTGAFEKCWRSIIMVVKTTRKIVNIDEEKCNGCGACTIRCAEGALQIIDGKARLVSEVYCDGLGACLGECPLGAITIEERRAEKFDEEAVERHLQNIKKEETLACGCPSALVTEFKEKVSGCPGSRVQELHLHSSEDVQQKQPSTLRHWPVQLTLVPPKAPFLKDKNVLLAAHCTAFAYGGFHRDFIKDHALLIACPKLDDVEMHLEKLTQVVAQSGMKSLTIVRMEVPCCGGLVYLARKAVEASGRKIPLSEVVIGVQGDVIE